MNARRSSWTDSFRNALRGIDYTLRNERNMRVHAVSAAAVTVAALWLRVGLADWLWLSAAVCAVWTAELLNTAVERAVDIISPEQHPLAGAAKDAASGAVLVTAAFAVIVGLAVLAPPLWRLLFG